jgi:hypothetical protein
VRNFVAIPVLFVTTVLVIAGGVASCKQGEGDRCQVNSDCDTNLICNQATQTCATTSGGGIDATVIDAPIDTNEDAPMIDAMIDAPLG